MSVIAVDNTNPPMQPIMISENEHHVLFILILTLICVFSYVPGFVTAECSRSLSLLLVWFQACNVLLLSAGCRCYRVHSVGCVCWHMLALRLRLARIVTAVNLPRGEKPLHLPLFVLNVIGSKIIMIFKKSVEEPTWVVNGVI